MLIGLLIYSLNVPHIFIPVTIKNNPINKLNKGAIII